MAAGSLGKLLDRIEKGLGVSFRMIAIHLISKFPIETGRPKRPELKVNFRGIEGVQNV